MQCSCMLYHVLWYTSVSPCTVSLLALLARSVHAIPKGQVHTDLRSLPQEVLLWQLGAHLDRHRMTVHAGVLAPAVVVQGLTIRKGMGSAPARQDRRQCSVQDCGSAIPKLAQKE